MLVHIRISAVESRHDLSLVEWPIPRQESFVLRSLPADLKRPIDSSFEKSRWNFHLVESSQNSSNRPRVAAVMAEVTVF